MSVGNDWTVLVRALNHVSSASLILGFGSWLVMLGDPFLYISWRREPKRDGLQQPGLKASTEIKHSKTTSRCCSKIANVRIIHPVGQELPL